MKILNKLTKILFFGAFALNQAEAQVDYGIFSNPLEVTDLITRNGNAFSVGSNYDPDSVKWSYYRYALPVDDSTYSNKSGILSIDYDVVIRLTIAQNKKTYTQKNVYFKYYGPTDKGSFNLPIDSMITVKIGTELSINNNLNADSILWNVQDSNNIRSFKNQKAINLYKNSDVNVLAKSKGKWFKQHLLFNGILYDSATFSLQAPVIKDALYIWYLNGISTGVTTSSYTPSEPGTYKVLVTWIEVGNSTQNARMEQEAKSAVYTFEVQSSLLTGLNSDNSISDAAINVFPNPANDYVSLSNVSGTFNYSICSITGAEIQKGLTVANTTIDISSLEDGVYLIHIKTLTSQVTKRFIVK